MLASSTDVLSTSSKSLHISTAESGRFFDETGVQQQRAVSLEVCRRFHCAKFWFQVRYDSVGPNYMCNSLDGLLAAQQRGVPNDKSSLTDHFGA